jgi:hypothetical protein
MSKFSHWVQSNCSAIADWVTLNLEENTSSLIKKIDKEAGEERFYL